MNISSSGDQRLEQVTPQMYPSSDSDLGDGLEMASETEFPDEDPFEDFLDIDDSVADKLQYDRSPCLPRIDSNLKCDEVLPTCGSCNKFNIKCRWVEDTQDRGRKRAPQPRSKLSRAEPISTTIVGRGLRHRVYDLVEEPPERLSEGVIGASSAISHGSDPRKATNRHFRSIRRLAIHPPIPDLHPPLRDSREPVSLEKLPCTPSVTKEALSPPFRRHPDSGGLGSDIRKPLVLNSGGSDSEIGPESLAQSKAAASKTDLRNIPQLAQSSKASSVTDNKDLSSNTRLFRAKNSTCEKCRLTKVESFIRLYESRWLTWLQRRSICVHHVIGDDQTAIALLGGQQPVHPSANQQPIVEEFGNDDATRNEDKAISMARIDVEMPAPAMPESFFVDHSRSRRVANSDMPISRSQDRHFAPRLPAAAASQPDSSEDSDPPINPSQRRRHNRFKNTDTPHPRLTGFHRNERHKSGIAADETSDSDAPLVPSWKKAGRTIISRPVHHRVNDNRPQAKGGEDSRDSPWCPQSQQPLLDDPLTNALKHSTHKSRSPNGSAGHYERQHHTYMAPQTRKPIVPVPISISAVPLTNNGMEDDVSAEYAGRSMEPSKARQQRPKKARPNVTLCDSAMKSAKQRPKFGLKDIIPEAERSEWPKFGLKDIVPKAQSSTKRQFTLKDIIPSKEPALPRYNPELKEFHDDLRMSFSPFLVGPEPILNAPVKKRKFTLADVAGMPEEPLFNFEYAIEQYLAHQEDQEQGFFRQATDQAQSAEAKIDAKQEVSSIGGDAMSLHSNDIGEERPLRDTQNMVESAPDIYIEPNWTEAVDDAESFLAGTWNGGTVKEAKD